MKIAIVGGGISGLTAVHHLHPHHEVSLFEANDYVGGHTNTIEVGNSGQTYAVDTGFIVFNYDTYPNFTRMLNELGVDSKPTEMSFSMKCERTGLEYRGADLSGLFAQRRNLVNPRFYRLLRDLLRFNKQSTSLLDSENEELTVGQYLDRERYSREFIEQYFLPMGSAVWSCPHDTFREFPIRFIVEFYRNHGMLAVKGRPQWRVIRGGSRVYVDKMLERFGHIVRTNCPIATVARQAEHVEIRLRSGEVERFDHVIFACHSDQALKILGEGATATERDLLTAFPYERNVAQLHTDASVLPRCRRAWASWNYFAPLQFADKATVTYNMNILQGIKSNDVFCVTLNGEDRVDPAKVLRRIVYSHPVFTTRRTEAQRRHLELINLNRTSFCGAYWGNGFHEDGVNSALAVCQILESTDNQVQQTTRSSVANNLRNAAPVGLS